MYFGVRSKGEGVDDKFFKQYTLIKKCSNNVWAEARYIPQKHVNPGEKSLNTAHGIKVFSHSVFLFS